MLVLITFTGTSFYHLFRNSFVSVKVMFMTALTKFLIHARLVKHR